MPTAWRCEAMARWQFGETNLHRQPASTTQSPSPPDGTTASLCKMMGLWLVGDHRPPFLPQQPISPLLPPAIVTASPCDLMAPLSPGETIPSAKRLCPLALVTSSPLLP